MTDAELIEKYHDKVKKKFLGLGICPEANEDNTKVLDCFYNSEYKDILLNKENTTLWYTDFEPTRQLHKSIMNDVLSIKDTSINTVLLRIHSPYNDAQDVYENMETSKRYIIDNLNHSMKVFLFDDIDSDFYQLI